MNQRAPADKGDIAAINSRLDKLDAAQAKRSEKIFGSLENHAVKIAKLEVEAKNSEKRLATINKILMGLGLAVAGAWIKTTFNGGV